MKKMSKLLALLLAFILLLSAVGCSAGTKTASSSASTAAASSAAKSSAAASSAAASGSAIQQASATGNKSKDNDLVIAVEGAAGTLDPHNYTDTSSISACGGMYESLVTLDSDHKIIGLLADSWDVSDDGLTYTFHLHEGIKFHDGTDFNADAVVANFDRILDKNNKLSRTNSWYKTTGDSSVARVKVTKTDDMSVQFQLLEGWSSFLNRLALIGIISPDAIKQYGNDIMYHPCGTGPYIFKEWVSGDHVTMTPNKDYWGTVPTVDSVTILVVPEAGTRTSMLQTGEADFVYPMTSDQIAAVSGDANISVTSTPSNIMRYVTLNEDLKQLKDVKVRQAMNYAIDKDAYVKVMYNGYATVADSVFPSTISYYEPQTVYKYDLDKAKSLMKDAGYEDGFDLTIWCDNTTQEIKGATFIKQQLAQININVTVVPYDAGTMDADIYVDRDQATIQMWYVNWSASDFSADSTVRALLYSGMEPPVSANTAYYENADFDKTLDEALATSDTAKMATLYAKCQELAWADCPWLFLAVDNVLTAQQSYVSGVTVNPDGRVIFGSAALAQ